MKPFGHAWRDDWALDPAVTYLNHGTVGAPPRRILAEQQRLRDEIERQPSRFLLRELTAVRVGVPPENPPRLRVAAAAVARFFGARGEDLVFVDNATTGVNAVLRSLAFSPGDEILISDHVYGAVANTARFVARRQGARVRTVELPYPAPSAESIAGAFEAGITAATKLVIVDHITSETALLFPVAEIAARCRARGIPLLVDGAHAPGSIVLDIPALGADWYVANLHKWAWTPRSSGFLWAAPGRQRDLHPAVISWGLDQAWTTEFDLVGTRDPTPHLVAPAALALLEEVGFEAVRRWNHELVWDAARRLGERWGTRFQVPESMVPTMVTLPLPPELGSTVEEAARLRDALLDEDGIEVNVSARLGHLWVRVAAQIYNELADIDRLGEAVERRAGRATR